jgi:hypothetical protein
MQRMKVVSANVVLLNAHIGFVTNMIDEPNRKINGRVYVPVCLNAMSIPNRATFYGTASHNQGTRFKPKSPQPYFPVSRMSILPAYRMFASWISFFNESSSLTELNDFEYEAYA